MQHEGAMEAGGLANVMLDIGAVISDRAVDVAAAAHEKAELAAETITDGADLAVAFPHAAQELAGVLHVLDAKIVVEVVVEVEGLPDMVRIAVGQLDARLLAPEQVGH